MSKDDDAAERARREQILAEEKARNERLGKEEAERVARGRRKDGDKR